MDLLFASLVDYGLFLAKTLTLLLGIVILLVLLSRLRQGSDHSEQLEVTDLSERHRNLASSLKEFSLSRKDYKAFVKAERKREKEREKEGADGRNRLFVIDFKGDIRASEVGALRVLVTALLLEAREGDEVLVRLDNAGGMVSEHGLAASQLARIRAKGIPLTVAVDKVAASGGYLMACVADRIIAAPFAVLGSIGVLAELPNFHRLLDRYGVDFELHTAGAHKRTLTLFGENTDEGRAKLCEQLEETHSLFKTFVAEYRPELDLDQVATGEYWHGQRAVELGLVDSIQTSDDFLLDASQGRDLLKLKYRTAKKPIERLLSAIQGTLDRAFVTWRG
ncbi:peptidase S49 [Thiorhodococcus drewsii AZ1]|uniref:Peptidase S49 n=1 Tax=Thiorhodococcus drewsii AZ1 TaxID=765913 RepID=G2E4G1_9GAMM|nr:protease SohB [Thiorhodococcus drewsii]EGV29730.1 peptidase S49 [Thiorhodococcus drewsii AZ1]